MFGLIWTKPKESPGSDEAAQALISAVELSDDDIGHEYADTEVTNLILVLGVMEATGIRKVTPLDINLADGLLARGLNVEGL